jgi:hypothetical protein
MRDVSRFGLVGLSAIAFLGCGGGGGSGPSVPQGQVSESGAQSVALETASLVQSLNAMDGEGLSGSVMGLALSGPQEIVSGSTAATAAIQRALTEPGPSGGTVNCDASGCVYDHYADNTAGIGTITMDGSVRATKAGDVTTIVLDMNLKADISQDGLTETVNYDLSGHIDVSATMIDGVLTNNGSGHASFSGQNISYTYFEQLKYQMVTLAADGSPSGGSIYAKWAITTQGQTQGYEGTVTF